MVSKYWTWNGNDRMKHQAPASNEHPGLLNYSLTFMILIPKYLSNILPALLTNFANAVDKKGILYPLFFPYHFSAKTQTVYFFFLSTVYIQSHKLEKCYPNSFPVSKHSKSNKPFPFLAAPVHCCLPVHS